VTPPAPRDPAPFRIDPAEAFTALPPEMQTVLLRVAGVLASIDFGTVLIVVQDSRVVQIETAEKFRLR